MNTFTYINNTFVPAAAAALQVSDLALQRGYGIFDFFKTLEGRPVFLEEHLDRFCTSAAQMRLPLQKSREELKGIIRELLQRNHLPASGIRLTLTGGYSPDGYSITAPNLVITQQPLRLPAADAFEQGLRLLSYPHRRQLPEVKSLDYLMAIWLQPHIREHQADDVLYRQHGLVTECPRANFFIVTGDDTVMTPARDTLKGIIRNKVLQLARKRYKTEEGDVTLAAAQKAKEAFITSTTRHILPVLALDGRPVGEGRPGPVTTALSKALEELVTAHIRG
ncbi:aminotransferase class IV [Chitinophaga japonensis]|uniref:branched-chain-amino-acid transaminase n=1 Tax=Chitinophaga japonensis TaxID=104662 RepID=A0A562T075_CHIJA|nr:aminotransferase class IV [Chitinophaga japonensis]TWI86664.1 D-alanine transaminase/branched-chain amino acid aminotransferase [Chitinophaga japonensis]